MHLISEQFQIYLLVPQKAYFKKKKKALLSISAHIASF